jgi:Family of unknown function (DUF5939)
LNDSDFRRITKIARVQNAAAAQSAASTQSAKEQVLTEALNEQLIDERLAQLEAARSWSPRLLSKLESHIRSASDEALFRINPFTFARERNAPENEVLDLFLHAAALGQFRMDLRSHRRPQRPQHFFRNRS